jgi:hypothetical protein
MRESHRTTAKPTALVVKATVGVYPSSAFTDSASQAENNLFRTVHFFLVAPLEETNEHKSIYQPEFYAGKGR